MIFLLDTNAFSDIIQERGNIAARLTALSPMDRAVICPIGRGEVLYGIELIPQGRRRQELEAKAARIFARVDFEPVPEAAGDYYARIKRTRQRQGLALDDNDIWIAATALALGATLVSRDSDFQRIDGLTVIDWTV